MQKILIKVDPKTKTSKTKTGRVEESWKVPNENENEQRPYETKLRCYRTTIISFASSRGWRICSFSKKIWRTSYKYPGG